MKLALFETLPGVTLGGDLLTHISPVGWEHIMRVSP